MNLRRLPYSFRKRMKITSEGAWLVPEKSGRRSVDRGFPTVASPVVNGGDEQTERDLERKASVETEPADGILSADALESSNMNSLYVGFMAGLMKEAADEPGLLGRIGDYMKAQGAKVKAPFADVGRHVARGWREGFPLKEKDELNPSFKASPAGFHGAARGLLHGLKEHPALPITAAALASGGVGYLLGKRRRRRRDEE